MFDSDKAPKLGVPQGFTEDIPQSSFPSFVAEKKAVDTKVYIYIGAVIAMIMVAVTIAALILSKPDINTEKFTEEDMVNAYISVIQDGKISSFDGCIYSKAKNKGDIREFLSKSQEAFADAIIYPEFTEMEVESVSDKEEEFIRKALGKKVENPRMITFDIYYSSDIESEATMYTTFSFYFGDFKNSTYFAYGQSGDTCSVKREEPEVATPLEAEEEPEEEVTMITVGNPDIGTVDVPSDYILADYDTSMLSKVKAKYTYKSPDGMTYVVLMKFSNAAKNIRKRAENVTAAFIPDYTLVTGEEVSRLSQAYFGYGESGNSRVETYTTISKLDGCTRVLAIVAPKENEIFNTWSTYTVDGGFNTLPGESPIPDVPDGMKIVGNDSVGYILVAEDFNADAEYNFDNSKGWTRGDETIAIISEKDSPRESIALSDYAEYVKETYLGEGAEEWDTGDWFPGAMYSRVQTDEKSTEVFCFKGKDGVNRLLLVLSKEDGEEVSTYYKNYVLPSGVEPDTGL